MLILQPFLIKQKILTNVCRLNNPDSLSFRGGDTRSYFLMQTLNECQKILEPLPKNSENMICLNDTREIFETILEVADSLSSNELYHESGNFVKTSLPFLITQHPFWKWNEDQRHFLIRSLGKIPLHVISRSGENMIEFLKIPPASKMEYELKTELICWIKKKGVEYTNYKTGLVQKITFQDIYFLRGINFMIVWIVLDLNFSKKIIPRKDFRQNNFSTSFSRFFLNFFFSLISVCRFWVSIETGGCQEIESRFCNDLNSFSFLNCNSVDTFDSFEWILMMFVRVVLKNWSWMWKMLISMYIVQKLGF